MRFFPMALLGATFCSYFLYAATNPSPQSQEGQHSSGHQRRPSFSLKRPSARLDLSEDITKQLAEALEAALGSQQAADPGKESLRSTTSSPVLDTSTQEKDPPKSHFILLRKASKKPSLSTLSEEENQGIQVKTK